MQNSKLKFKIKTYIFLAVMAVVLAGWSYVSSGRGDQGGSSQQVEGAGGEGSEVEVAGKFVKGERAPKVVAETFSGDRVDIGEFYGSKAVVIDFWAGWCPFCVAEMPELEAVQEKYKDELVVIGAHRTDTESVAIGERFAVELGVTYILIKDGEGNLYRAAGGIGMPVAVFIDKSGIVREVKSGPKTIEEIGEKVKNLL